MPFDDNEKLNIDIIRADAKRKQAAYESNRRVANQRVRDFYKGLYGCGIVKG